MDKQKLPLAIPLGWLGKWLHDLAGLSLAGIVRYHPEQQAVLQQLVARCDPVALMRCQDALQQLAPFGQHTLNTRLQLEALLMDYLKIFAGGRQG
ncbi:hypothetical protein [Aquitalea magnusonii]|uniref:hypothetical protein n=1 Tax=Aquitalea magnusonii TaxID=332411 RepID=UPI001EFC0DE4|nr:hypothetical protein [Aquitalea magnusonii]